MPIFFVLSWTEVVLRLLEGYNTLDVINSFILELYKGISAERLLREGVDLDMLELVGSSSLYVLQRLDCKASSER